MKLMVYHKKRSCPRLLFDNLILDLLNDDVRTKQIIQFSLNLCVFKFVMNFVKFFDIFWRLGVMMLAS